jgi:outer membrane usher protein
MKPARPSRSPTRRRGGWRRLLAAFLLTAAVSTEAHSQPGPLSEQQSLILEVRLNGSLSPLLWQFELLPDGVLATSAERLRLLGFNLALLGVSGDQPLVRLSDLPGVSYRYLDTAQAVEIDAVDAALVPVVLDAASAREPLDLDLIERNLGVVLNYSLFGDVTEAAHSLTGQYEVRLLSPWGFVTTSGFGGLAVSGLRPTEHIRLDTYWRYVDPRGVIAYSVGDVVSESYELGSIYRLGGVQVQRDFASRPDLVTTALPIFSGTAAVPSMVDLYLNGMRYYRGETGRGPFEFRSLPNIGGGAKATVVLTDATGRELRIEQPIFFAPSLLPRGMLDFSVEAGFPRLNHGTESFDYLDQPAASGTVRYGVTDWLTVGAHAEGMQDFANGSAGAIVRLGGLGTVTAKAAASWYRGTVDTLFAVDAEAYLAGINFYAGIERADAGYQTVVRATDRRARIDRASTTDEDIPVPPAGPAGSPLLLAYSSKTDRAGASFSLFDTGVTLSYTRLRLPQQDAKIAGASVYRTLFGSISAWANGFRDFGDQDEYGVFVGFSLLLGNRVMASSDYAKSERASSVSARVWRDPDGTDGSWGWTLTANHPLSGELPSRQSAMVRYLAHFATLEATVEQRRGDVRATAYIEGSVVAMGDGVFFSQRIDDGFAIVRGGGERTPVLSNTRPVTRTDRAGRALVPFLSSFQENVISIDPAEMAIDLRPQRTEAVVVPADKAGVIIDFGVERVAAALVILVDAAGAPLPVGSVITLEGGAEPTVVGFDGRAYLTDLSAHNRIRVRREDGEECSAGFDFAPVEGEQVLIGPLTCQ